MVSKGLNVWLATTAETLPIDGKCPRLWRTGHVAKYMSDRGHRVTWWTSDFIHTTKAHRFGRNTTVNVSENLQIRLLASCGYKRHVGIRRIIDHRQVATQFDREADAIEVPDVIISCFPTIELCAATLRFARRRGVPIAMDVRDAWPDIFEQAVPGLLRWPAGLALLPYQKYARKTLRGADALISLTPSFLTWALRKAGRERLPLDAVVPMTYTAEEMAEDGSMKGFFSDNDIDPRRHLVISLFCTFGRQFDIRTILDAARRIEADGRWDLRWVLCGSGDGLEDYRREAADLKTVSFAGWLSGSQIKQVLSISAVGIAPYIPARNFWGNIPNKPVEYMSAGLPILTCLEGELTDLVKREDIGFCYHAGDVPSLMGAITEILASRDRLPAMGRRSRAIFTQRFHPDAVLASYHDAIIAIAGSRHDSGVGR